MFIHAIIPWTHSVLPRKSSKMAPSLCSLGWKLSAVLLRKPTQTLTRIMSKSVQDHRSIHCTQTCRSETLAMEQPAQSASVDEKGKAINPLVRRPQLSTFTHRVMNHECELLDAPADTLLYERCTSDRKRKIRRLQSVFKTYKKNYT